MSGSEGTLVGNVEIISSCQLPEGEDLSVIVHYHQEKQYKRITQRSLNANNFQNVILSKIDRKGSPFFYDKPAIHSFRDIVRTILYSVKNLGLSLSKATRPSFPVLDLRKIETHNIAHLLHDVIPYYRLCKASSPNVKVLLRRTKEPFVSFLNLFGVEAIFSRKAFHGKHIQIRAGRGLFAYEVVNVVDCHGLQFYPDTFIKDQFPAKIAKERIFIARKPPRSLSNHGDVLNVLEKRGYETIYMEDYSVEEQLAICANAKHVIAIHGAAMAMLALNRNLISLIEIFPPHIHHLDYPSSLRRNVANYHQIVSDYDPRVQQLGWGEIMKYKSRNFLLPLDLLEKAFYEIFV